MQDYVIRPETSSDSNAISGVIETAFGQADEAVLVQNLRSAGDLTLSLVADQGGALLGHVALSRMASPFPALGLAPVSVIPDHQRHGIGRTLIRAALDQAREQDWTAVFVLGDPEYYQQFGFRADLAAGFTSPYAGPYFMVLPLQAPLTILTGRVDYAAAFQAL